MSEPVNKWNQPTDAPPPMFFGRKERDLVKQVNDELAERVVGQTVAYYPVSLEDSNYHPLYGEAVDKVTLPPIRVFAYVAVENEQTNERYGYEYQSKLTVNFNRKRLTDDQDLFVRVGDFLQYGDEYYEIVRTYNDTRYYFGQVEHKFQISADCVKARKGTFRVRGDMKKQLVVGSTTTGSAALPLPAPPPAVPFAPSNAQYIVLSTDANLTQERVLTAGDGITLTDGGANGSITIEATAGSTGGIFTQADSSNAYTTSSVTIGSTATPTHTLTVPGAMSGSGALITMGAATFGSTLNVTGAMTLVGTGSLSSINMTGTLSGSSTARFGSSISSSGDLAVTGNVHAAAYYGDGASLTNVGTSGSARHYSTTGLETSGYLKVTGSTTLAGTGSVSSLVATGSISGSSTLQAVGAAVLGSTLAVSGSTILASGLTLSRTAVTAATYTILVTDFYLGVDTSSNTVTLTLPAAATAGVGKTYVVKDEGGSAGTNAITLDGNGTEKIDGATTFPITSPYGAANLYTDGSNWFIY